MTLRYYLDFIKAQVWRHLTSKYPGKVYEIKLTEWITCKKITLILCAHKFRLGDVKPINFLSITKSWAKEQKWKRCVESKVGSILPKN